MYQTKTIHTPYTQKTHVQKINNEKKMLNPNKMKKKISEIYCISS